MASKKRKELSLAEKIKVIKASEGQSQRQIDASFDIPKTTVSNILKRKVDLLDAYDSNQSPQRKRVCIRTDRSVELDKSVFEWFSRKRALNLPVSGPLLQEKARDLAEKLGITDFKASNGWLEKFKSCHNISFQTICGERGSVDPECISDWKAKVPDMILRI